TAVTVARTVNYDNAGTVEFLLDDNGDFYFLEMNTRLQVEHPVTEMVTGLDLVAMQIKVAAGQPLPLTQADVVLTGHAVEARIYAENPANDFLPVTGDVLLWRVPEGNGIRVDDGIQTGDAISLHYDPMLAKIIAHGPDRQTAVQRLKRAVQTAVLLGFTQNISYLLDIIQQNEFVTGHYNTYFVEQLTNWSPSQEGRDLALIGATLTQFYAYPQHPQNGGYWRNNSNGPLRSQFSVGDDPITVLLQPVRFQANHFQVTVGDGEQWDVVCEAQTGSDWTLLLNGRSHKLIIQQQGNNYWVQTEAGAICATALPRFPRKTAVVASAGSLRAPMPGTVLAVLVTVGQTVAADEPLLKLEAMKMEHTIRAATAGVVSEIFYSAGDAVAAEAQLLHLEPG
ncbi:MAG: 3-methylcrotonyl-CoA carboxylase, partial [Chloroflexi bacterium]|nr:3-methylcrotonyl-CoA carboxylase [Chloroflexota bacterium]